MAKKVPYIGPDTETIIETVLANQAKIREAGHGPGKGRLLGAALAGQAGENPGVPVVDSRHSAGKGGQVQIIVIEFNIRMKECRGASE